MVGGNDKSPRQVGLIREAGNVINEAMSVAREMIRPGVSTGEVDLAVEKIIRSRGGVPCFKGYSGHFLGAPPFPGSICASINEEVVHGIPSFDRVLEEGDIFSMDVGVKLNRFIADAAYTFAVGKISAEAEALLECTKGSLLNLIPKLHADMSLFELGGIIEDFVKPKGFSVVREYVGHGVGKKLHEDPQIPHFANESYSRKFIRDRMVVAIEPMVNLGGYETKRLNDGWTVVTADGKLSAHFEHTIAITKNGADVLTGWGE